MAFGSFSGGESAPMSEINTTPLVDVMLVLLVVFIVTAPVIKHSIKVDLPKAEAVQVKTPPVVVRLAIDAAGSLQWDGAAVGEALLPAKFGQLHQQSPDAELHIYADRAVRYEVVAKTMASARKAGLSKIGLMTEAPKP